MSVINPTEPLLIAALAEVQKANYASASALTFLAYDIFYTFPDEVEYIWSSKWSFAKVAYFFTRYYSLVYLVVTLAVTTNTHLTAHFCKGYFWYFFFAGQSLTSTATDIIFILRIHALYNHSVKVLVFLVANSLVQLGLDLWICVVSGIQVTETVSVNSFGLPWPGCIVDPISEQRTIPLWIVSSLVAFTFFALTMFKFRDQIRDDEGRMHLGRLKESRHLFPLFTLFVRDGVIFFFLIFCQSICGFHLTILLILIIASLLVSAALTVIHQGAFGNLVISWLMAIYSFVGTHIILNMRASSRVDPPSSENITTPSLPGIPV